MEFIESSLPPPPARVLDAGCGDGALAARLIERGYAVTAIDIDPSLRSSLVRVADICTYEDEPFDAVIFSLSLHHVHSLERALERTLALLKPGGRLIIDEFAHENADEAIAEKFFGEPGSLTRWREHHGDYHTGRDMLTGISARFTVHSVRQVPYLHRYLEDRSLRHIETVLGLQLIATNPVSRKDTAMTIQRTTRFTATTADTQDLLDRRATLIADLRAANLGPLDTRLTRLEDGTFADAWRWDSVEAFEAAAAAGLPAAAAAFAVVADITAENAEILDER